MEAGGLQAARAPEITFVVPAEIHLSLCRSEGTQQNAEKTHALKGPWSQKEEVVKYTDFTTTARDLVQGQQ